MNDNIFKLPEFSAWNCTVTHLASGHGSLDIRLTSSLNKRMKLQFYQVFYFGGWTQWKGANFRFATDAEYFDLARKDSSFDHVPDKDLILDGIFGISKLFVCNSEYTGLIYIMAGGGRLLDKDDNEIIKLDVAKFQ